MAEDLFGTNTSLTDPAERKILADVMQQFNISRQIADRQRDRYGLGAFEDTTNTYEIERARQLTDLLNRARMSKEERDRLAAEAAARLEAQKAAAAYRPGVASSGLTQEQLQQYIDALNKSGAQPPRGQTWASLLAAAPGLINTLFGGAEGNLLRQQGILGYGMDKLSGLFGLGKGGSNPFGQLTGAGDPKLADDPFNLNFLLGEGNKLPQLMNLPPPMSFEEFNAGNFYDDWGIDGTPMGWEPPDPDPLPPLYGFDE